jgi:glycosyltransferase involved in cell wall biosynthesis
MFRSARNRQGRQRPTVNSVLMIAFHYPPCGESSGVHRSLKFSRYLEDAGWHPIVLTAHPRAYDRTVDQQLREIPATVPVRRAFALDASRHLSVRGVFPRWMTLPDRWASWWLGAVPAGLSLIRRHRPRVIWSTYPVATAHLIGLTLHRLTGLPWIADFRDPMTEEDYPPDVLRRRVCGWIERRTVRRATRLVFVSESAVSLYRERYPALAAEPQRSLLIPNGYDETDFRGLATASPRNGVASRPLRLVHAGLIYPEERDPRPLFRSLSRLKREGLISTDSLQIDLRASGSEAYYRKALHELNIHDIVHLLPAIPYRQVLQECLEADGLLLMQGKSCNRQIPVKTYEYLRAGKPILALTPEAGDTAGLLRKTGGATVADLDDEANIVATLPDFLSEVRAGTHPLPDAIQVAEFARDRQACVLAATLTQVARN